MHLARIKTSLDHVDYTGYHTVGTARFMYGIYRARVHGELSWDPEKLFTIRGSIIPYRACTHINIHWSGSNINHMIRYVRHARYSCDIGFIYHKNNYGRVPFDIMAALVYVRGRLVYNARYNIE